VRDAGAIEKEIAGQEAKYFSADAKFALPLNDEFQAMANITLAINVIIRPTVFAPGAGDAEAPAGLNTGFQVAVDCFAYFCREWGDCGM